MERGDAGLFGRASEVAMEVLEVAPTNSGWAVRLGDEIVSVLPSRPRAFGRADWLCRQLRLLGTDAEVVAEDRSAVAQT